MTFNRNSRSSVHVLITVKLVFIIDSFDSGNHQIFYAEKILILLQLVFVTSKIAGSRNCIHALFAHTLNSMLGVIR